MAEDFTDPSVEKGVAADREDRRYPGLLCVDAGYRIREWNGWMERSTGILHHEAVGMRIFDLFPECRDSDLAEAIGNVLANLQDTIALRGQLMPIMDRRVGRRMEQIALIKAAVFAGGGRFVSVGLGPTGFAEIGDSFDIGHIFEAVSDGMLLVGWKHQVQICNSSAAAILGRCRNEIIGVHLGEIFPGIETFSEGMELEISINDCEGQRKCLQMNVHGLPSMPGIGLLIVLRDVTRFREIERELRREKEKLLHLAMHDALTGLANRRMFEETLTREIAGAKRYRRRLAVIYVDLNQFKPVNDQHGHKAGDIVLVEVGKRLRKRVRSSDVAARLGGDEFAVLLCGVAGRKTVEEVAREIAAEIETPVDIGDCSVRVSASVGIGLFPDDGETSEALLKIADSEMFAMKDAAGAGR